MYTCHSPPTAFQDLPDVRKVIIQKVVHDKCVYVGPMCFNPIGLTESIMCVCVLSLQGPCDSLGISVAGGVGSPHGNVPLFIATMDTSGLAAKTQQLQVGRSHLYCVCLCVLCVLHRIMIKLS